MIPTAPIPDALFVLESIKRGRTLYERVGSVLDIVEPLLGVDRSLGEHAYVRRQGNGWLFVTKDQSDTIYGPTGTPLRGQERYDWIDDQNSIRRGYLKQKFRDLIPS